MNDQWKEYVESLRRWSNLRTCRLLKLIDAQDAVVKAAQNLQANLEMCGGEDRDLDGALRALAELKLE